MLPSAADAAYDANAPIYGACGFFSELGRDMLAGRGELPRAISPTFSRFTPMSCQNTTPTDMRAR